MGDSAVGKAVSVEAKVGGDFEEVGGGCWPCLCTAAARSFRDVIDVIISEKETAAAAETQLKWSKREREAKEVRRDF